MHEKYFTQAAEVAKNSTCNRAHCGSVIVSGDNEVIGSGFNAPPLGDESQRRCDWQPKSSEKPKYDKTCCVHAEWNAIIDALKNHPDKINGSTLYFMRISDDGDFTDAGKPFCTVCSRLALQSGVSVFGLWNNGPQMLDTATYNKLSYDFYKKTVYNKLRQK
jgi:deoxycytidylate deaminase